jgi:hypothetical protein
MAPVFGDEGDPLAGEIEQGRAARDGALACTMTLHAASVIMSRQPKP